MQVSHVSRGSSGTGWQIPNVYGHQLLDLPLRNPDISGNLHPTEMDKM